MITISATMPKWHDMRMIEMDMETRNVVKGTIKAAALGVVFYSCIYVSFLL